MVALRESTQKTIDGQSISLQSKAMQPNVFLEGNFAPIEMELTLSQRKDFQIKGTIPRDLHGSFYRNGPNPAQRVGNLYHWFFGDGMIHCFHFSRGNVTYRNAWVRTPTFILERRAGQNLFVGRRASLLAKAQLLGKEILSLIADFMLRGNIDTYTRLTSKANRAILIFRDHIYALGESSPPLRLSGTSLETEGFEDFGNKFNAPFTAHPKLDPQSGYLYVFGYRVFGKPRLEYYVINPTGRLIKRTPIEIPYAAIVHDFAITRNYALLPVFPAVSSGRARTRGRIAEWEKDKPALLYLLHRSGERATVRTLELPKGFAYHYVNAYEDGEAIYLDALFYDKIPLIGSDPEIREELFLRKNVGAFSRFRIDLKAEKVEKQDLWQEGLAEFPVIDNRLTGEKYEHAYAAFRRPECTNTEGIFDSHVSLHIQKGKLRAEVTPLPPGHFGGEPVFVPTGKPGQNQGYLLNIIYDSTSNHSYLAIFDAARPERRAVCEVHLPHRIPYGFHGAWRPGRG